MILRQRTYDIDDLWERSHRDVMDPKHYELIDGALIVMSPPGGRHGQLAVRLGHYLVAFADALGLGVVTAETGYHAPDSRQTVLSPDVAFVSRARAPEPFPDKYVPLMPDLAIEILSPSNTYRQARRKARICLQNGAQLVWIVMPGRESVEICRLAAGGGMTRETVAANESLSGEDVLPGFELALHRLFAP